jgi:uncharacterized protein YjbI with pentapeptide repeats
MGDRDLRELQAEIERLKAELAELRSRPAARLRGLLALLPSSRRSRLILAAAVLVVATASYAASVSMPYTFVNGTIADADQVNANFGALVAESNDQDSRLAALEVSVATLNASFTVLCPNCDLTGIDFAGASLGNSWLPGADLSGVTWSNTTCPDGSNSDDDDGDGYTCLSNL